MFAKFSEAPALGEVVMAGLVVVEVTPLKRATTIIEESIKPMLALAKDAIALDAESLKALMRVAFQEVLVAEKTEALGVAKGEQTGRRFGYRSGYYDRDLISRIGKIELQDGLFSTELFERYACSENAAGGARGRRWATARLAADAPHPPALCRHPALPDPASDACCANSPSHCSTPSFHSPRSPASGCTELHCADTRASRPESATIKNASHIFARMGSAGGYLQDQRTCRNRVRDACVRKRCSCCVACSAALPFSDIASREDCRPSDKGNNVTASFSGMNALVVGGAGFVGSNLVRAILAEGPRRLTVVDNFLSSDPVNVPGHPALRLVSGSTTNERILREIDDDLDDAFHLACYHGNQSSIFDPLADNDNNTLTTLKLFERLKDSGRSGRWSIRPPAVRSRRRPSTARPQPPRTHPFRCSTTAPIRFPS